MSNSDRGLCLSQLQWTLGKFVLETDPLQLAQLWLLFLWDIPHCSFNYSTCSQCLIKGAGKLHITGERASHSLRTKFEEQRIKPLSHHVAHKLKEKCTNKANNHCRVLDHPDHMTRKWIHLKAAFKELNLKDKLPLPHLIICCLWCMHCVLHELHLWGHKEDKQTEIITALCTKPDFIAFPKFSQYNPNKWSLELTAVLIHM